MIARGFKSVLWVGGIGAAALTCYIFSLQVAEERAGLAQLEGQIERTRESIQTLKTELGTRSRVHQLQRWASADFGYTSPGAAQFVPDEVTLASLDAPAPVSPAEAPVRMADAPAPAPSLPRPVQAAAPAPAPQRPAVRLTSAAPSSPSATLLRRASADRAESAPRPRPAAAREAAPAARPARALVDQGTLRDIERQAGAERGARAGTRNR